MNRKMSDRILLSAALVCLVVGVIERLVDQVWIWTPQGWWRGSIALIAFAIASLLVQIRDRGERNS